jgi:hypothetical protein
VTYLNGAENVPKTLKSCLKGRVRTKFTAICCLNEPAWFVIPTYTVVCAGNLRNCLTAPTVCSVVFDAKGVVRDWSLLNGKAPINP